jgi:signal transduction histidine kinase
MTQPAAPSLPSPWLRAIGFATAAPDAAEALPGMLAEGVPATGADAGAVLDGETGRCRASWGLAPEEVRSLLVEGGPVHRALRDRDPAEEAEVRLALPAAAEAGGMPASLLLVPLRARGLPAGFLLLRYPPGDRPSPAERENAHAFAGLAALVVENDRLFEEARQARQARDHFLIALNHELRTPASALTMMADLLRDGSFGALPEPLDRALRETEQYVQEMVDVLRRVVDLGGLESQAVPERADILRPREVVTDLLRRVEPAAKRKQLSLTLYVPRTLPSLQTDAARFSRVLLYLLSNAIKYTAQGGIEVRVERAMHRSGPNRREPVLVVRIRDTGRGIPPEELARIFEPFAQVEEGARTDSRSRGLGLGLPLARQLARSLGGDIAMESTPGQGTTATVFIPYTQQ